MIMEAALGGLSFGCNRSCPVDPPRKTLAEFSRVYLRSLESAAIVAERRGADDDHYAAHVAEGIRKAKLTLVPTGRRIP